MSTLHEILIHQAQTQANKPAIYAGQLSDQQQQISYGELLEQVEQLATALKAQGCQRLGLYLDNSPDWIRADLAAMISDITLVPIPLFFSKKQIAHLLTDAGLDSIIMLKGMDTPLSIILGQHTIQSCSQLPHLSAYLFQFAIQTGKNQAAPALPAHTAKITYTSGSTGDPKGVCLSLEHLLQTAHALAHALKNLAIEKHLCVMPMATLLENIAGIYVPLIQGCCLQIESLQALGFKQSSGLNPGAFIKALQTLQPHSLITLPQLLQVLTETTHRLPANSVKPADYLRFIAVGGGKTSPQLLEQAEQSGLPVYEGYGLSECASVVSLNTPDAHRLGSVGRPLFPDAVSVSKQGEIRVTRPAMLGYLGNKQHETGAAIKTGDLGYFDSEGYLYLSGRIKNLIINSFGRNISPEWVESELEADLRIAQCMIYGDNKSCLGAVIVPAPHLDNGAIQAALQDAIHQCNQGLPDYAQIRYWLIADHAFTLENGQLTYNGRPRREHLLAHYGARLNAHYQQFISTQEQTNQEKTMSNTTTLSVTSTISQPSGFFEKLTEATQAEREYLLQTPIIHDALQGQVNIESYIAFLTQAYHHVKHTVPLLMSCGSRLDEKHEWLRSAIAEYIEEELGHEQWILDDIAESGGDRSVAQSSKPNLATEMMVSYAYDVIQRKNPVGFFGMVFVLEGTSIQVAPQVAEKLKSTLAIPNKAYTYLDTHGSLDLKHMDFFKDLMNQLNDSDDQQAVIDTAKAMFHLYSGVFRSLPRTHAENILHTAH